MGSGIGCRLAAGKAADRLAQAHMGCIGITAGEIAPVARVLLNELIAATHS